MDAKHLENRIRAFLCDEIGLEGDVAPDEELLSTGRIDSADLVRIATFLEKSASIRIPDGDVRAAHFDSIARMLAYVEARAG